MRFLNATRSVFVVTVAVLALTPVTAQDECRVATVVADDAAPNDYLGTHVVLTSDRVFAGASYDDDASTNAGSAYVFKREITGWVQEAELTASDAGTGDNFGTSLAVSVDRVVVGAPDDNDNGTESGSAYVFRREPGG